VLVVISATLGASCQSHSVQRPDAGAPVPSTCIGTCVPDPGSQLTLTGLGGCQQQEAGLELSPKAVWDFETGSGRGMYVYTDDTTPNIFSYADQSTPAYDKRVGFEPTAAAFQRCTDDTDAGQAHSPSHFVMHLAGGPFRGFGGGMGISFSKLHEQAGACMDGGSPAEFLCPESPGADTPDFCPASGVEFRCQTLDLSRWDGISLWARRGPNGQAALRVGLGDIDTDDDISYLMSSSPQYQGVPRRCERNLGCDCGNQKPCAPYTSTDPSTAKESTDSYCWDPADPTNLVDPKTHKVKPTLGNDADALWTESHTLVSTASKCGKSRCADIYAASQMPDPFFNNRACTTYSAPTGGQAQYCYDPTDATEHPPYDSNDTCGDHWVFPINLTTDWRLYLVPFTALSQQGFGKKFARPLVDRASMLRLMWDVGWIDYWVDDVRFYRTRKN
jgi:hypothetical protein